MQNIYYLQLFFWLHINYTFDFNQNQNNFNPYFINNSYAIKITGSCLTSYNDNVAKMEVCARKRYRLEGNIKGKCV